jgi:hypothetical protein
MAAYIFLNRKLGLNIHGDLPDIGISDLGKMVSNIKRIPLILYEYQRQFFGPKKWNIIWIIFLLSFIFNIKRLLAGDGRFLTLTILFIFCGYTAVYMLTPQNITWHLSTTASRFFIHFVPIVILWLSEISLIKEEDLAL